MPPATAARGCWGVGCMLLILIEALSSAYRRGMLALGQRLNNPQVSVASHHLPMNE